MASSPHDARLESEEIREHEATEMNHYDRSSDLSMPVSDNLRAISANTGSPEGCLHRLNSSVKTFWKRQVRVTVAHEACRDHFGTLSFTSLLNDMAPSLYA